MSVTHPIEGQFIVNMQLPRMKLHRLIQALGYSVLFLSLFSFTHCAGKTVPADSAHKASSSSSSLPRKTTAPESSPAHSPASASSVEYSGGTMENSILYYVNRHRQSRGQNALKLNKVESDVAAQHSRDMASGRVEFGHGGMPSRKQQINKRLGPVSAIGENVAYGQTSAKEVVDAWLQSPGHRRNIEGNFMLTGIGLARDRRGLIYYTQIFTR